MFILQVLAWFVFCCILMSFIEHQVHSRFMHKRSFLAKKNAGFKRMFEMHAIFHHEHYSKIFSDEPVPPGEDQEIRLTPWKGAIRAIPIALVIGVFSWVGALVFIGTVYLHHWLWNQIHLEMHKPEHKYFENWPVYQFLARYHLLHHRHPNKNFNVVFPLADYVLGTHARATASDLQYMHGSGFKVESLSGSR
jgi:hypothetical protein